MYDDKVIQQLKDKGLSLQKDVTIEEVQYYFKELEMVDKAKHLKEDLEDFIKSKKVWSHISM